MSEETAEPGAPSTSTFAEAPIYPQPHPGHRRASHETSSPPPIARKLAPRGTTAAMGPALQRAVEVYRKAILHEQRSELDDALRLYRTAFRMDPNVDRAYHLMEDEQQRRATVASPPHPPHKAHHQKTDSSGSAVDNLVHDLEGLGMGPARIPVAHARGDGFVTGTLAGLVASWPDHLSFEPENEQEGVPIKTLPDEMLLLVLRLLDHTSIERFARVNRKARVLTLDASLWRSVCSSLETSTRVLIFEYSLFVQTGCRDHLSATTSSGRSRTRCISLEVHDGLQTSLHRAPPCALRRGLYRRVSLHVRASFSIVIYSY